MSILVSTWRSGPSLQSCFPYSLFLDCVGARVCFLMAELCLSHCWTSWDSYICPFLYSVQVPLHGNLPVWYINHYSQFCGAWKLAESVLWHPAIYIVNEVVQHCRTQYWFLGNTSSYWPPDGVHATDHSGLRPEGQAVFTVHLLELYVRQHQKPCSIEKNKQGSPHTGISCNWVIFLHNSPHGATFF